MKLKNEYLGIKYNLEDDDIIDVLVRDNDIPGLSHASYCHEPGNPNNGKIELFTLDNWTEETFKAVQNICRDFGEDCVVYDDTPEEDLQVCEACEKKFDVETMTCNEEAQWFCRECIEVLGPVMQKEYDEAVAKGEIDPED